MYIGSGLNTVSSLYGQQKGNQMKTPASGAPTSISLVPTATALRSEFIILISTIDISSTIIQQF